MNRRNFFKRFATVSAAMVAAPVVAREVAETVREKKTWGQWYSVELNEDLSRTLDKIYSQFQYKSGESITLHFDDERFVEIRLNDRYVVNGADAIVTGLAQPGGEVQFTFLQPIKPEI